MSSMTLAEISDVREHLWVLSCEREGENKKIIGVLFKGSAKINIWKRESKKKSRINKLHCDGGWLWPVREYGWHK